MTETTTREDRLRQLVEKGKTLTEKGVRSADESKELEIILTEAREVRAQLDQDKQMAEFGDWAGQSRGRLPMATRGADVENVTPAGETVLEHHTSGVTTLSEQYGDGIFDAKMVAKTNTRTYKRAFGSYLRGEVGPDSGAIRTLQEAGDVSGGLTAA